MSGSFFTLNQKYNNLKTQTNGGGGGGVPTSSTLADVLLNGNSAGASDIDMNNNDILQVDNIDLVTINGSAYPPVATTATNLAGGIASQIPYQSSANTTAFIANGTSGQYLKSNGTAVPSWATIPVIPATPSLSQVLTAGSVGTSGQTAILVAGTNTTTYGGNTIYFDAGTSLTANNSIVLKATDTAGSGKAISIDKLTPNIWYNLNTGNVNDRLVIDNTGAIECVSGLSSSAQGFSLQPNNFLLSNFDLGKGLEMNTDNGIRFTSSGPIQTASYTPIQMTIDDTTASGFKTTMDFLSLDIGNTATSAPRATLSGAGGTLILNQSTTGYTSTPSIKITNFFTTAGSLNGVPSVETYKSGRVAVANDVISSQNYYAKNYTGVKTEFAKIEALVRNTGLGNDDGLLRLSALINGVMTTMVEVNGADTDLNTFLPIDMNGNRLKSTTGSMIISTDTSIGTGNITITPKLGANLILQNLPTAVAGLPSGSVWNNLGVLSIAP